ncbi:PREDICTED: uncharacterized protein LOC107068505 isoform X2 [Polistes dominula]|uniref:Uncharacterized protein LOC107068505 isoform X2 n=1 Tax=Polistes dominula TaxID=743375 RepID=A0ABM1IJS3_POLDO|nr:PREDICTED: uncharacterized protein LOC107068505 isoform X2 [Polistes dominula]
MNLKEANVISISEEDIWLSSNNLEMESICNVTNDFVEDFDFSSISSEVNNETSNGFTETLSDSICIRMDKKEHIVNPEIINLDSHILKLILLGAEDTISCMSFQCDSRNNKELLKLQSEEDMLTFKDLCNTRNLPNILRGPKSYSKRKTFSFPFDTEDNSYYTNEMLENNIFVEESTKNMETSHRKRKQKHDPLTVEEESINWVINSTNDCDNSSKKKIKLNSRKTTERNCSNKRKQIRGRKSLLMKEVNNEQPVNETSQKSNVTSDSTASILEQDKGTSNDVDISLDFITCHEEQIHEDYIDHFDILTDILKEQQVLNDNCYNINSNTIYSSNILDYQKVECHKSLKDNVIDQVENSSESPSDCKDFSHHKSKDCLLFEENSETSYVNNYLSSYFNDSLDNSLDIASCQEHSTHNIIQNSLNKDKTKHLDSLLLKDEEKYKAYLESKLNNDLVSSNSNFLLINVSKSKTDDYLNNNLEDSTIVKPKSNTQQNVQFDVLPDTDLSAQVSLDSKDISSTDVLENDIHLEEVVQEKKRTPNKYIMVHKLNEELELECDYKETNDKKALMKTDNSNHIKKVKEDIKETLQCLLCPLTFPSKRSLALHVSGAHGDMYMILCERCGRLFNKKCVFNNHFIYCGCVKLPFDCNKCNKSYRHKSSLIYHLKIVHKIDYKKDTNKEYKCDVCSKIYKKYGAFEKHLGQSHY